MVAVLAVTSPGEDTVIAWCGDTRAYGWTPAARLRQYTTDHTVGQQLRVNGVAAEVAEQHDNWLQCSLAHATVATVYEAAIPAGELVVLTSDGVHDHLPAADLAALVAAHAADPDSLARPLVTAVGERDGVRDDATVGVLSPWRGDWL